MINWKAWENYASRGVPQLHRKPIFHLVSEDSPDVHTLNPGRPITNL